MHPASPQLIWWQSPTTKNRNNKSNIAETAEWQRKQLRTIMNIVHSVLVRRSLHLLPPIYKKLPPTCCRLHVGCIIFRKVHRKPQMLMNDDHLNSTELSSIKYHCQVHARRKQGLGSEYFFSRPATVRLRQDTFSVLGSVYLWCLII